MVVAFLVRTQERNEGSPVDVLDVKVVLSFGSFLHSDFSVSLDTLGGKMLFDLQSLLDKSMVII